MTSVSIWGSYYSSLALSHRSYQCICLSWQFLRMLFAYLLMNEKEEKELFNKHKFAYAINLLEPSYSVLLELLAYLE